MLELNTSYTNHKEILVELLTGSGVVVIKDVFDTTKIKEAREVKVKNLLFLFWVQTIMFISKINKPNNAPLVL